MKYEENVWYGWNGGECPVHPETVVQVQMASETREQVESESPSSAHCAREWMWGFHGGQVFRIIAFRVIKEHKEPREWRLVVDRYGVVLGQSGVYPSSELTGHEIIHVKEVME